MLTVRICVKPIQCYSLAAMAELQQVFNDITANPGLVRHFVMASDVPGVFNFGGDLSLFVLLVRARDLDSLRLYARRCIDLVWWLENAAQIGVHTTALVQGDTLGWRPRIGAARSTRSSSSAAPRPAFPRSCSTCSPAWERWNLTIRRRLRRRQRDDPVRADLHRRSAASSRARRHRRRGRRGEAALDKWCMRCTRACAARWRRCRRAAWPLRLRYEIAADDRRSLGGQRRSQLNDRDMRLMERLARAQVRKVGGADEGAVEEIKRMELDTAWGDSSEPASANGHARLARSAAGRLPSRATSRSSRSCARV